MTTATTFMDRMTERLPELIAEHGVPGAQVAVLHDGQVTDTAAGVLSTATGVEATTDAVFQTGSIGKVWTATLALQLVDDGLLDLDTPVRQYLPEFRVADAVATRSVTTRQLLSHTTGFEGDLFHDTGRGDDAIQNYLPTIADAPQLFAPGAMFSYCNSGYVVLGRLVEVLRDAPFHTVLHERLAQPLRLTHLAHGADEAILHRAAVGHVPAGSGGGLRPAPVGSIVAANAPAGTLLAMSAHDLLGFARMHIDGGRGPDGPVLSETSARAMQHPHVTVPDVGRLGAHWGLGWEVFDYPGGIVIGHDGVTLGQSAFLRVVPEAGVAVALLTNGGDVAPLYQEVVGAALGELAGVRLPAPTTPPTESRRGDVRRAVGHYDGQMLSFQVSVDDDRIWLRQTPHTEVARTIVPEDRIELTWLREDALITVHPYSSGAHLVLVLTGDDGTGRAAFLHHSRAVPRRPETTG